MYCCSKQPVRGEKTSDPRTGCVGDYAVGGTQNVSFLGRRYFKLPILSCPRIPPATQAKSMPVRGT
jgi:hypothetical protein